jgi:hypothetical protein
MCLLALKVESLINDSQKPDHLCTGCLSIFTRDFHWQPHEDNVIQVDPENPVCRLCALLSYRFSPKDPPQRPFKIGYSLTCRLGYFTQVWDILFQPWDNQVIPLKSVQLTLQVVNRREGYDYIDGRIKVMGLGATDGASPRRRI